MGRVFLLQLLLFGDGLFGEDDVGVIQLANQMLEPRWPFIDLKDSEKGCGYFLWLREAWIVVVLLCWLCAYLYSVYDSLSAVAS